MRITRALIALILLVLWAPGLGTQEQLLRVHFIDVGQGDAVLIQSPSGQNVLYDGGEDTTRVRDYLVGLGISEVGLAIASHNHADHIGGLAEVLRTFRPRFYMDNGVPATTQAYTGLLEAVAEAGSQLLEPTQRRILLGDASLVVVPPPGIAAWDQNDNSIGMVLEYGNFRLSLMGDAEQREWAWWFTNHRDLLREVQVHKASHHGSANGDTSDGIVRLSPEAVAIGVGAGNSYGHPDAQTLRLYGQHGATVYRTDLNGTVIVEAQASGSYTVRVERGEGTQPTPTPTPTASVTVQSISATTERQSNGDLNYPVTFQVRESGGVDVTLSTITMTTAFPGGTTGTGTVSSTEAFGTTTLSSSTTLSSRSIILTTNSTSQATQITIRVPWSATSGISGTAEASASITAAPPTCSSPGTPSLSASVSGSTVTFSWSSVSGASDYALGVGTSVGVSGSLSTTTSSTSYTWSNVSSGTYYARVRARNSCGTGSASNEVTFSVAGSSSPPSSWSGNLPPRSSGSHPVCQTTLPSIAQCVNDRVEAPQAICNDRAFSCSTGSGTCSGHGGVYCWRD